MCFLYVMNLFLHLSKRHAFPITISCHGKPTKLLSTMVSLRIFFTDLWYRSNAPWAYRIERWHSAVVLIYCYETILVHVYLFCPGIIFPICASHYVMKLFLHLSSRYKII